MPHAGRLALLALLAALCAARPASAQLGSEETATVAFARAQHPELADLLVRLKSADRNAYDKAVRDVAQARERLERIKDAEHHALALRAWTLDSRIRLLAAKLSMGGDAALETELRDLLIERRQVRLESLRLERAKLVARLEKIDAQTLQLEADPAAAVDREFDRLTREVRATRAARNGKAKPNEKTLDKRK